MKISKIISRVGERLQVFPTFLFLVLISLPMMGENKSEIPDFAFPQTVIERSDSSLNIAVQQKNDLVVLRELMNLIVAGNLLKDSQNVGPDIVLIDSVAKMLKAPYSQIGLLLEAEILWEAYTQDKINYDRRNLPLDEAFPISTDEWSGKMYKERILNLVDSACKVPSGSSPISIIEQLLDNVKGAESIGMTVEDFIYFKSEAILKQLSGPRSATLIPFYPQEVVTTIEGRCEEKSKQLMLDIIHSGSSVNSVIKALAWKEYSELIPDYSREKCLKEAWESLKNDEGAGLILYNLYRYYPTNSTEDYSEMKNWLEKFPQGYYSDMINLAVNELTAEKIEASFDRVSLPGKAIKGKVNVSNLQKGYLLLFKLSANQVTRYDELIQKKLPISSRPLTVIDVEENGVVPFKYEREVELPSLSAGLYVVVPSKTKSLPKDWNKAFYNASYPTIRISDIAILTTSNSNEKDSGRVYVVKGENQKPVAGATVSYYKGDSSKPVGRGVTNKDGWVKIPDGYYRIVASYGKNIARQEAGFSYYPETNRTTYYTTILTDLGVYRPGDTVRFAVLGWKQDKVSDSLVVNKKVDVTVRGANYSKITDLTLVLNEEGRAAGDFVIPKGNLLGNYTINASYQDFPGNGGSANFLVEEYKLPAFAVTMVQESSEDTNTAIFEGSVKTFAGMPVSNARVVTEVNYQPWRWGLHSEIAAYNEELFTDSEGKFKISLPLENLKGTVFANGRYSITAEATAPSGESVNSRPLYFYLGKNLNIQPSIRDKIEVRGDSVKFYVPVYDMAGLPVKETVDYKIINLNDTTIAFSGKFESPSLLLPEIKLPSGKYSFGFSVEDNSCSLETVIWRSSDTITPYPTPLWVPETDYLYGADQKEIKIKFGSYWNDWILMVVSDGSTVQDIQWLNPKQTLYEESINIPANDATLFVSLSGMHDFTGRTSIIKISPQKAQEKMEILTESFRENITAGDKEEWNFRFKIGDRKVSDVEAFAVMTDKALNSIRDFRWDFNIWHPVPYCRYRLNSMSKGLAYSYKTFTTLQNIPYTSKGLIPDWNTYGYSLVPMSRMIIQGPMYMKTMQTRNSANDRVAAGAVMEDAALAMDEEATIERSEESPVSEPKEEIEMRPVEMPLAFFMPNLSADSEGRVSLKFIVPNFNTTWQLQLAGYDASLNHASLVLDAVASKSVMVKTNLPQFLRTGDKAEISATIYNNSEDTVSIGSKMQIFDPFSGKILMEQEFEGVNLGPSANSVVSVKFDVPETLSVIGVRSMAFSESHSDCEQGYVNVLPSSAPVVESKTFYASSQQQEIELKVPKLNKNANVTLKYCDNPLWEILLSLPSLTELDNPSSLSLARWLYGSIISDNIINSNPIVYNGIKNILESGDSTLSMSNLQKDETLKIVTLNSTPWVNNAESETSRIRGLQKYFDREAVTNRIALNKDALIKLQNKDGGWSWFEGMKSSPYITSEVLGILGCLKGQGLLDEDLERLALKGVRYYDNWLTELYNKDKKTSLVSLVNYFYIRNKLSNTADKTISLIEQNMLDSLTKEWRYFDLGMKAKAALIMLDHENYIEEAAVINKSMQEFITKRTPLLQEALMLETFNKFNESEAVEKVIEKMMLQKETESWGNDYNSPYIINSLMGSINPEAVNAGSPQIYIDGRMLELPENEQLIGSYTISLDHKAASGKKITIKRDGGVPAWGGVITQYIAPIKSVKAEKVENLSVRKHLYKEDAKGNLKEVSTFRKGDKITVVLNLNCGKDMDYVALQDFRAACLQPEDKVSGMIWLEGLAMYKETGAEKTSFFIENLPAGNYVISYECHADRDGEYSVGLSEVQCLYTPSQVAHSSGDIIIVKE